MGLLITLSSLMALISMIPLLSTPLMLGILMWICTLTILTLMTFMQLSWSAMMLFLVYISGMLIMFAYFIMISTNMPMMKMKLINIMMMFMILLFMLHLYPSIHSLNSHSNPLYIMMNPLLMILLTLILFIILISVTKLVSRSSGMLRSFNS